MPTKKKLNIGKMVLKRYQTLNSKSTSEFSRSKIRFNLKKYCFVCNLLSLAKRLRTFVFLSDTLNDKL